MIRNASRRRELFLSAILQLHARCYRHIKFADRVRMYAEAKRVPARGIPAGDDVDVWNCAAAFAAWQAGDWDRPEWLGRGRLGPRQHSGDDHLWPIEGSDGVAGALSR